MPNIVRDTTPGVVVGTSRPPGILYATDYGLTHATDDSQASANVTALQAVFNQAATVSAARSHGMKVVIPPGRYVLSSTGVTIPRFPSGPLFVESEAVKFRFPNGTTNATMFKTALPTDGDDAELANDQQDQWEWKGGLFDCRGGAGTRAFEWNAVSRLTFSKVMISNAAEGVRARFCLHYHMFDSVVINCSSYGVRIEEDGDWTGGTPASAASNGTILDNVRFYGASGQLAQLRIAHSGHIIDNCTFEGTSPLINVDITDGNTSTLSSIMRNVHCENSPTTAHLQLDVYNEYQADWQYVNSGKLVKVIQARHVVLDRLGYPDMPTGYTGSPRFEAGDANTKWTFRGGALGGGVDPFVAALWEGGTIPTSMISYGAFAGTNNDSKVAQIRMSKYPSGFGSVYPA